jgi:hypothetical protein
MNKLDQIKQIAELEISVDSTAIEQALIHFFKKEYDISFCIIKSLSESEILESLPLYYSSETNRLFDSLIPDHSLLFLTSNHNEIKEKTIDYLKEEKSLNRIKARYNPESKNLVIQDSKIAQILLVLTPSFNVGEIDGVVAEFKELEVQTNQDLDVQLVKTSFREYKIETYETKKQEKFEEEVENRRKSLLNKFNVALSSSVVLASLIFAPESHAQANNYNQAIDSAKHAALIQSGVQAQMDSIQNKASKFAEQKIKDAGMEAPSALIAYGYKTIKTRQVNFHVNNLLIDQSKYSLTLSPDRVEVGVQINF